jgi:hypothetical protein
MTQAREIADLGSVLTVTAGAVTVGNSSIAGSISVANSAGTLATGMYRIANGVATAVSTLEITLPTGFRAYKLILGPGIRPSSNSALLAMRVSYDGGSTFATSGYSWGVLYTSSAAASSTGGFSCNDTSTWMATAYVLSAYTQNSTENVASSYEIDIIQGESTTFIPGFFVRGWNLNGSGSVNGFTMGGGNHNTTDIYDAVRILVSSGTFTGRWALYGVV